tara:strand:+ start:635 stop:949 length:315 start_codon:yes stop_codon:yes gene_type:complete
MTEELEKIVKKNLNGRKKKKANLRYLESTKNGSVTLVMRGPNGSENYVEGMVYLVNNDEEASSGVKAGHYFKEDGDVLKLLIDSIHVSRKERRIVYNLDEVVSN